MYVGTQNDAGPVYMQDEGSSCCMVAPDFGQVFRCEMTDKAACGDALGQTQLNGDCT